jgi:hypothetical protein
VVRSGCCVRVLCNIFTCGSRQYESASTMRAVPESISQNLAFEFDYAVSKAETQTVWSLTLETGTFLVIPVELEVATVEDEEAVAEAAAAAAAAAAALRFGTILRDDIGVAVVDPPLSSIFISELPEPGVAVVELAVAAAGSTAGEAVVDPPLPSISISELPVLLEAPVENSSSKSSPLAAWHDGAAG